MTPCTGISRVATSHRLPAPVPRPRLLTLLLGIPPLLGGGLAWAQLEGAGPPAAAPAPALTPPPAPALPAPPPPASPAAGAGSPGSAGQGPLVVPPAAMERPPLRPNLDQLGGTPPPRRFDQSLDELVRQGIVTPGERARIRNGSALSPIEALAQQQACRSGALSSQECRSGLAVRWRGRAGSGEERDGEALLGGTRLGADGMPLPPITVPVSALLAGSGGNFSLASVFGVTPRPAPILGNGNRRLLFPVIGSALTTSSFGWRLHPVLGSWLMHAGRDLAAPEGTPVVAALGGRVVSSGLAGGYGLAIEIEHQHPLRRTLYGHLSELYVEEGARVRQGEVIGRVGSTGLSTGPHLHFELRQPADGGWVAIDPGELDPGKGVAGSDAVALLMGQLLQSLERPRSAATAKAG